MTVSPSVSTGSPGRRQNPDSAAVAGGPPVRHRLWVGNHWLWPTPTWAAVRIPLLVAVTFLAAFAVRIWRLEDVGFAMDQSTLLWMARDALAGGGIPDHGLVSSLDTFQPPGLVWVVLPAVAWGTGDPAAVMVWLAVLNAAGLAILVSALTRATTYRFAVVAAALLVTSPFEAAMVAAEWHPSLYGGAMALLLAAGLRLRRGGSALWALALPIIPALFSTIHFSGVLLVSVAVVLCLASRRPLRELLPPVAVGIGVALIAIVPFAAFEVGRGWLDVRTAIGSGEAQGLSVMSRLAGFTVLVVGDWGTVTHQFAWQLGYQFLIWLGLVMGLRQKNRTVLLFGTVALVGMMTQALLGQAQRGDIALIWQVPTALLAAHAVTSCPLRQLSWLMVGALVTCQLATLNVLRDVSAVEPTALSLRRVQAAAGVDAPLNASYAWAPRVNALYLPSDPPYLDGSEVWYLRDLANPGLGRALAVQRAAFSLRT